MCWNGVKLIKFLQNMLQLKINSTECQTMRLPWLSLSVKYACPWGHMHRRINKHEEIATKTSKKTCPEITINAKNINKSKISLCLVVRKKYMYLQKSNTVTETNVFTKKMQHFNEKIIISAIFSKLNIYILYFQTLYTPSRTDRADLSGHGYYKICNN